jgi:hypothetical protein
VLNETSGGATLVGGKWGELGAKKLGVVMPAIHEFTPHASGTLDRGIAASNCCCACRDRRLPGLCLISRPKVRLVSRGQEQKDGRKIIIIKKKEQTVYPRTTNRAARDGNWATDKASRKMPKN